MNRRQVVLKNLRKNIQNYYLYIFALIFTSGLYFAFVTLQYDPVMKSTEESAKQTAALKAASVMLIIIVAIFLLYANKLFMKRRSNEIALFQLIGMTKQEVFRLFTLENIFLYFGSLIIGVFLGFSGSKIIKMLFFKITHVDLQASLSFSLAALGQTLLVFLGIFVIVSLMNYLSIKRHTILSLFRATSSTEGQRKSGKTRDIIIGILGILLIGSGYYVSQHLLDGNFQTTAGLFSAMIYILGAVIIGTYLFYKGSITFVTMIIRRRKQGYMNIQDVLSLSSIMFRMKSNAFLLTVITIVSASAIGLLSLSYISYYSTDKLAEANSPSDFSFSTEADVDTFEQVLTDNGIDYKTHAIHTIQVKADTSHIFDVKQPTQNFDPHHDTATLVSAKDVPNMNVEHNQAVLLEVDTMLKKFMNIKDDGNLILNGTDGDKTLHYQKTYKQKILPTYMTGGSAFIVNDQVYQQYASHLQKDLQHFFPTYYGIDVVHHNDIQKANDLYTNIDFDLDKDQTIHSSQFELAKSQRQSLGLILFIVGFLGLAFLVTSGCILYFKQMDEGEDEKPNYTILRKLGFTQGDLLKGIQAKQFLNFGIPLLIGLLHSYFAVRSGWFVFGTELWTPMIIVMVLYAALYSIFGVLSVFYYKKLIKRAL